MKKFLQIFAIATVIGLSLASCAEEEVMPADPDAIQGITMTLTNDDAW